MLDRGPPGRPGGAADPHRPPAARTGHLQRFVRVDLGLRQGPGGLVPAGLCGHVGLAGFGAGIGGDVGLRRAGEVRFASDPEEGRRLARRVADARGRPARFAERATRVLLEVESIFRDPTRQNRST